ECGDVERLRGVFEADEAALYESVERGIWDSAALQARAELAEQLAAATAGELGHDGELVFVELGEAFGFKRSLFSVLRSLVLEDGDGFEAASVALLGERFAEKPAFFHHGVEHGFVGAGGRADCGELGGFPGLEVVEDGVLAVLVFGAEFAAARGALGRAFVEDAAALLGDAVDPVAPDLGGEGEHAAQDFAERRAVVLRDPAGELEELGREECGVVEEALDFFYFDWFRIGGGSWWVVVQPDDDAEEALAAEGDQDACADFWGEVAERVGEGAVEWDR